MSIPTVYSEKNGYLQRQDLHGQSYSTTICWTKCCIYINALTYKDNMCENANLVLILSHSNLLSPLQTKLHAITLIAMAHAIQIWCVGSRVYSIGLIFESSEPCRDGRPSQNSYYVRSGNRKWPGWDPPWTKIATRRCSFCWRTAFHSSIWPSLTLWFAYFPFLQLLHSDSKLRNWLTSLITQFK